MNKYSKLIQINLLAILTFFTLYKNSDQLNFFWPSMDMITFFPYFFSDMKFGNDFMTSCYADFTGRYYFGIITGILFPLFTDWYSFLLVYRFLIFIFLPLSWYLALKTLFKENSLDLSILAILIFTALGTWRDIFSFATWNSYFFHFHPSSIASIFTLLGIYFLYRNENRNIFSYLLILLGSLSHPIFSFSILFIFNVSIFVLQKKGGGQKIIYSSLVNIVVALIQATGSKFGNLSTEAYSEFFAKFHPHHYLPSGEENILQDMFKIGIFFLILYIIPNILNNKEYRILSVTFYILFLLGFLLQYYFVEKYPFSKYLILISPSRFSSLIYWMFIISAIAGFRAQLEKLENKIKSNYNIKILGITIFINFSFIFLSVSNLITSDILNKSSHVTQEEVAVFNWVKENSEETDTFLVMGNNNFNIFFTPETSRGQYLSVGYPFNDRCIEENYIRKSTFLYQPIEDVVKKLSQNQKFEYFITNKNIDSKYLNVVYLNKNYKVIKLKS